MQMTHKIQNMSYLCDENVMGCRWGTLLPYYILFI